MHPVDPGILHSTLERCWVLLNSVDSFPATRECKRDGVAACAAKRVKHYRPICWSRCGDVLCYFSVVIVRNDLNAPYLGITNCKIILCDCLMCNSIPSILGHPDTFVVLREDLVSLSEVAMRQHTVSIIRTHWH